MNFIKSISHSLVIAAGAGGRKLQWIAVCALLAAAAGGLAQYNPRLAQAEALHGEAAIRRLKTDGGYASLAAAMAAARHQINAAPAQSTQSTRSSAPFYANNIDPLFTQQQKLTAADAAALDQFGAAVALDGDTAVIGAPLDDLKGVSNQGSVYVFLRSGASWSLQQKLTASDGVAGDGFGSAVAISGDTVVASAFVDDIGANVDQGSVYVFTRSGGVWTQQQKLTAGDGATSDKFGFSVALGGDTVVVGALADDIGANVNQGSAYVFTRSGAAQPVWTLQQKLTASDGATSDSFGFSVAISGETVVVGAANDDTGRSVNQGSAYVFIRSGAVWTEQQKLTANDGAAGANFGFSVAISGDAAVVGAPFDDIGGNVDEGSAYIFTRTFPPTGAVWSQRQKLTAVGIDGLAGDNFGVSVAFNGRAVVVGASGVENKRGAAHIFTNNGAIWTEQEKLFVGDGADNDQFGRSVALSGETVVAGAPNNSGAFAGQGAAYVFGSCASSLVQQQQLTASDGAAFDGLGRSVAISGDTAVVGAFTDGVGSNESQGSAYVFVRIGGVWTLQQKLTASDGAANDSFGNSVAISGETVVVGSPGDDIGARLDEGSAYVFTRSGAVWTEQQKLIAGVGEARDQFGVSVAISGDTAVVGAFTDGVGSNPGQGSAYVFTRSGVDWLLQEKLIAIDGAANDFFGISVALEGDTVVVGAQTADIGPNADQGSAYVFTRSGALWTLQQKLTANDGAAGDLFGRRVAISGDTLVVGTAFDDVGTAVDQGSAYVFTRSGALWTLQQKLTAGDGAAGDRFGHSVALSGDTLVVGADSDDIGANLLQGSAYVFTRSGAVWTEKKKLTASDGAAGDGFGNSVAISGDTVVVGAFFDSIGANFFQGSAYVFGCP